MTRNDVFNIFVGTIDMFYKIQSTGQNNIFIETKNGEYLNFTISDFKDGLLENGAILKNIPQILKYFRNLGFIVTETRYTYNNVQRINKTPMRVITVKKSVYETLKSLGGDEVEKKH